MLDMIISAFRNIFRKRLRSFLTISGIAIGMASVVIIGAIGNGGKEAISNELNSLGLDGITIGMDTSVSMSVDLSQNELDKIRSMSSVEDAMPIVTCYTKSEICGKKSDAIVWGIDSGANQIISLELLHGRAIGKPEVKTAANVCLVDQNFAKEAYGRENIVGKKMEILLGGEYKEFQIIGIVKADSSILQNISGYIPSIIYTPYTTLQNGIGKSDFDQIAVKVKTSYDAEAAGQTIISTLEAGNNDTGAYKAENLAKQRDKLTNLLNIVTMVLSAIGSISLIVAGLGIMTSMIVAVNERTREIGIKKAIGASNFSIMMEFLIESLFVSVIGCLIGILIGSLAAFAAGQIAGMSLMIPFNYLFTCTLAAVILGVIFGVYPAVKASKLSPVQALRYE